MVEHIPPQNESIEKAEGLQVDEVSTLRRELEKERRRSDDYLNRLKYLQADFENYKKRARKEIDETAQSGKERLILELLTVLDELESAVEAGRKEGTSKAFLEGVEMTLNKLYNILKKEGLSTIEAVGKPFDPNRHEAVLRVQVEGNDGVILEEVRKGFMLKGLVIRPSLVTVAVDTSKKGEEE